jgi:hypothetical protein
MLAFVLGLQAFQEYSSCDDFTNAARLRRALSFSRSTHYRVEVFLALSYEAVDATTTVVEMCRLCYTPSLR